MLFITYGISDKKTKTSRVSQQKGACEKNALPELQYPTIKILLQ